jgi:hypothetical protein
MNDNELRGLFSEMREDPVPAESLARVRMAVAGRVQARRRVWGIGWKVAAAVAVCGCLAGVMLRVRTVAPVQSPVAPVVAPAVVAPAVVAEQDVPVETPPALHKRAPTVAKPVRQVEAAPASNVDGGGAHEIRIENPYDPDVVIVLIGG